MLQAVGMESIPWLTGPFRTKGAILLIQLRLGFPFNLALCTVLQTIPMALPTARGRQGPQELSAYRRTTRGKGSLVIFFAQANPPPRSAAEAVRRLRHGVDPAHAGGRAFNGFGPSAEFPKPG